MLKIQPEVRVNEVAAVLESIVDAVAAGIVESDTKSFLHFRQIEVLGVVGWRSRILVWVSDVVDTTSTVVVVWGFDIIAAHVGGFVTDLQYPRCQFSLCDGRVCMVVAGVAFSCGTADLDLVQTAVVHVIGKLGVRVNGVVVGFDAVGVIYGKFGVVLGLHRLIDDTVDYTEGIEVKWVSRHAAVLDLQILVVEVVEESWSIVSTVRLGEEVELTGGSDLSVKLGDGV